MVIAAQMEHTVRHEEGEFTQFAVSVFLRLFLHLPRVDHDVAEHHASVVRVDAAVVDRAVEIRRHLKLQGGKRENVRCPVDPPVLKIEPVHFLLVRDQKGDLSVVLEPLLPQDLLADSERCRLDQGFSSRQIGFSEVKSFFCLDICVQNDHGSRNPRKL